MIDPVRLEEIRDPARRRELLERTAPEELADLLSEVVAYLDVVARAGQGFVQRTTEVLDHGSLALDGAFCSDLAVVNAARVSLNQTSAQMEERDEGLIRFLIQNRHGSPFEHGYLRFLVKAPIMVVREHQRHRSGHSYNEVSGRYTELDQGYYVPDYVRVQVGKAGAYRFEPASAAQQALAEREIRAQCEAAFAAYTRMLAAGVAREVARGVLPLNSYTKYYWSCNPRSLMHFLGLRNSDQAQYEIRQYAAAAEELFAELMPATHAAFVANGRVAP